MRKLVIGSVDFGLYLPPPTTANRTRRRMTRTEGAYNLGGIITDFGLAEGFFHVFQSQDDVGYVTQAQMNALNAMFDNAATFTVTTDLLGQMGAVETFNGCSFDPQNPPTFSTKLPGGELWFFVIPLYLRP